MTSFLLLWLLAPVDARAWFIFIPGAAIDAIADAITGSEGENCVGPNAKVGDRIALPSGGVWEIKSISGTSYRCTNPVLPIRALLVASDEAQLSSGATVAPSNITPAASRIGLQLPEGWERFPLSELDAKKGVVLNAVNRSAQTRLSLFSERRDMSRDMTSYLEAKRTSQHASLRNPKYTETVQFEISGLPAWSFEVTGTAYDDAKYTYLYIVIDAGTEVVVLRTMCAEADFLAQRPSMERLAAGITGITSTVPPTVRADSNAILNDPLAGSLPTVSASKTDPKEANARQHQTNPRLRTPAQRLRELNGLLQEGLITQKEYEEKKKVIIDSL